VAVLLPARQEVPQRRAPQPRHDLGLLEGHRHGPPGATRPRRALHRAQEDAGVLHRQGAPRPQDRVDHERVPPAPERAPPAQAHLRPQRSGNLTHHTIFTPPNFFSPKIIVRVLIIHTFSVAEGSRLVPDLQEARAQPCPLHYSRAGLRNGGSKLLSLRGQRAGIGVHIWNITQ
jgi:hypothetical protein